MATTVDELEAQYYALMLGLNATPPLSELSRLRYLFYLGVYTGEIDVGGLTASEVNTLIASYLAANPPAVSTGAIMPTMLANTSTTFPLTRSAFVAANVPGYTGPIMYDTSKYLDHPGPSNYLQWDLWRRRRTV
jgi:hypothetical protein